MKRKEYLKRVLSHTNAILNAMRQSISSANGLGDGEIWKFSSYKLFASQYNSLLAQARSALSEEINLGQYDVEKIPFKTDLTWPNQKEIFDSVFLNVLLLKSILEQEIGYAEDETENLKDFIASRLRRAIFGIPDREVSVQDSIETLLVGRGMAKGTDYDRETGRVKMSGKESVPDFIFSKLNLCLEVKLSKSSDKLRSIVDEINADIRAYASRYDRQLYVVYDVAGTIRDEAEFKKDLENTPGISVMIIQTLNDDDHHWSRFTGSQFLDLSGSF